jgi:predicted HicB family RNase H-like nuclease
MSSPKAKDHIVFMVRLPADLHAALKERAAKEDRSLAATLRLAVRLYLERPVEGE